MNNGKTIIVRSGGGFPGLDIHAGISLAMEDAGIVPHAVHGTSAGAIISLLQAGGRSASYVAQLLESLSDRDVRAERTCWKLRMPWIDWFLDSAPIRELLALHGPGSYASLRMELACWAVSAQNGAAVNVARPEIFADPVDAAIASMSIAGVFPSVRGLNGIDYIDGGIRRNLPLPADWKDYDRVILCIAAPWPTDYAKTTGILTHLIRNFQIAMQDQIDDPLEEVSGAGNVLVLWPSVSGKGGMFRFDHSLIEEARKGVAQLLAKRGIGFPYSLKRGVTQ